MKQVSHIHLGGVGDVPVIDDDTPTDYLFPRWFGRGHDPSQYVPEMLAGPLDEMVLIDPSEYEGRFKEEEETRSGLEHVYLDAGWENLDQGSEGYCWAYSTGHCVMVMRSLNHQPYVRLNPHAVGGIIKNGRNEGGWCGLSAKFLVDVGIPSEEFWPGHSLDVRRYDTPALRANAALHKVTEPWMDLGRPVHGQVMTERQIDTCVFTKQPCAVDFNWWAHSVCYLRKVLVEAGSWGRLILNSWKGWGRRGLAILRGSKAVPDGAVSLGVTGASSVVYRRPLWGLDMDTSRTVALL